MLPNPLYEPLYCILGILQTRNLRDNVPTTSPDPNTNGMTEISDQLCARSEILISAWKERILESAYLRVREDAEEDRPPAAVLTGLLNAVVVQFREPDNYLILRRAVKEGVVEDLTTDATCRFHLAFKPSDNKDQLISDAEALFDEMLVRLAQFTHQKEREEVRALERGQRKVIGFDLDRLQTLLDTMNEGFASVDNPETITTFNHERKG